MKAWHGKRVQVWNGDKSKYLGEGTYVTDTNAYAILMPDGSLQSCKDATDKPDNIPSGGRLIKAKDNPMIEMDNGDIVFGCQTWWGLIPEKVESKIDINMEELLARANAAAERDLK